MLELEASRNGQLVIKSAGRWLASSIDPVREARQWAERYAPRLQGFTKAYFFGLGSGYPVLELARISNCSLSIVESDQEWLRLARQILPELSAVPHVHPSEIRPPSETVATALIAHPTAFAFAAIEVQDAYYELLARDPLKFIGQMKARGITTWRLRDGFCSDKLSIKDLEIMDSGSGLTKADLILNVLTELVK